MHTIHIKYAHSFYEQYLSQFGLKKWYVLSNIYWKLLLWIISGLIYIKLKKSKHFIDDKCCGRFLNIGGI